MTLPGKLCIGILEEDNPLKSYFRFKPILIRDGERFSPFDAPEEYPADGCIRIVPDKNESSLFKAWTVPPRTDNRKKRPPVVE